MHQVRQKWHAQNAKDFGFTDPWKDCWDVVKQASERGDEIAKCVINNLGGPTKAKAEIEKNPEIILERLDIVQVCHTTHTYNAENIILYLISALSASPQSTPSAVAP